MMKLNSASGGSNGFNGQFEFIQINHSEDNLPKNIAEVREPSEAGNTPIPCQTMALEVETKTTTHSYLAVIVPMVTVNTVFKTKPIRDTHCVEQFVNLEHSQDIPRNQKLMDTTQTKDFYNAFLSENANWSPNQQMNFGCCDNNEFFLAAVE